MQWNRLQLLDESDRQTREIAHYLLGIHLLISLVRRFRVRHSAGQLVYLRRQRVLEQEAGRII